MMALIQLCCCWSSLRSGCYASALYTTIYFTVTIVMVAIFGVADIEEIEGLDEFQGDNITQQSTENPQTLQALNFCVVTLAAFGLASTFLLFYGISKAQRRCFIPWIIIVTGTISVDLVYAVYLLIHIGSLNPVSALVFTVDFVLVVINVCSIWCVVSLYQQLGGQRSARRVVGLAVTDDPLFDALGQPEMEEFKLGEMAGCNSQSAGAGSAGQSSQLLEVETCWIDCRSERRTEENGNSSVVVVAANPVGVTPDAAPPASRRVTFNNNST